MSIAPVDPTTETLLRDYIRAKDENRPLFLHGGFTPDATQRMVLNTGDIRFPAESVGVDAVAETLVGRFNQTYENIFTFYLDRPEPGARLDEYHCGWMVGMVEKATRHVRVGCGLYDWYFQPEPYRVRHLTITIEHMQILPYEALDPVFGWLLGRPYPWATPAAMLQGADGVAGIDPVRAFLARLADAQPGRLR